MHLIPLRDKILDIIVKEFNLKRENFLSKSTKGKRVDSTYEETYVMYLCIIWFIENTGCNKSTISSLFGRHHSTAERALVNVSREIENRDLKFSMLFNRFNLLFKDNGYNTVTLSKHKTNIRIYKLTKEEVYHIKFMLKHNIPIEELAIHFRTNENSIKNIENDTQ